MSAKRIILGLLTLLAIWRVLASLGGSLAEPQIQSRLELYQTNLVLYASEFEAATDNPELDEVIAKGLGDNPLGAATKQYKKARTEAVEVRDTFQKQLTTESATPRQQLKTQVSELDRFVDEIDLKRGVLAAEQGDTTKATAIWQDLVARVDDSEDEYSLTATVLQQIWQDKAIQAQDTDIVSAETVVKDNLDSWFRDRTLAKLYQTQDKQTELTALDTQQQEVASEAIVKLAFISAIPFVGGFAGFILLLFLIGQLLFKKEGAILATNSNTSWSTPWDWEITWQVIIVGFFFVGQFVLPLLLGLAGINVTESSLRIKALYVLFTYILMAAGGIAVLFFSVKPYLPLAEDIKEDWFKFKFWDNWFVWGLGGYLVAIPCVLLVSLINQQIWNGQGGSNPLLYLALQAQDKVALTIFFSTASFAAPLFEELIFRGFLLPSLTRYFSVTVSIILSGLLFAVAHLSLAEVLPLVTLGIILGFVYTRSRNLLAPMLLHSLWNSGTLLSLFVLGSGV